MSNLWGIVTKLKRVIREKDFTTQTVIIEGICDFLKCTKDTNDRMLIIRRLLKYDLPLMINNMICSKIPVLTGSVQLLYNLSEVEESWEYFPTILRSLIRALVFLAQSDEGQNNQLEFVDILHFIDVLMAKPFSLNSFKSESKDMQRATFLSMVKFCKQIFKNSALLPSAKVSICYMYSRILEVIDKLFDNLDDSLRFYQEICEVGYLLAEEFELIMRKDKSTLILMKYLCLSIDFYRFARKYDCNETHFQTKLVAKNFERSIKKVLRLYDFTTSTSDDFHIALFSALNRFFFLESDYKLKMKVIQDLFDAKIIEICFILLQQEDSEMNLLNSNIKLLISAVISIICLKNDGKKVEIFEIVDKIFSYEIHTLVPLGQNEITLSKHSLAHCAGLFFYLNLIYLKQKIAAFPDTLKHILNGLFRIMKNVYLKRVAISDHEFWAGLELFTMIYAQISRDQHSRQIKQTSVIFRKLVEKKLATISFPPGVLRDEVLLWSTNADNKRHILYKLLPLYLSQESIQEKSRLSRKMRATNLIFFLNSNDFNQVKNSLSLLKQMSLDSTDLAPVSDQLNNYSQLSSVNLEAILSLLLFFVDKISDNQKIIIYKFGLKLFALKDFKNSENNCRFLMFLFDLIVKCFSRQE